MTYGEPSKLLKGNIGTNWKITKGVLTHNACGESCMLLRTTNLYPVWQPMSLHLFQTISTNFFARFEAHNLDHLTATQCPPNVIDQQVTEAEVTKTFRRIMAPKPASPDSILPPHPQDMQHSALWFLPTYLTCPCHCVWFHCLLR